ncbi:MAG TPA: type VI secretion system baseplate subunit TssK [Pyrinomonadaceae bacterium]|nr:type VI secretion system baseplate subunit TssK [Pyrinomonadaceae bacterium]
MNTRLASLSPYDWGVLELQLNQEAIANGRVELARCRAVMPDGLVVNVPEADAAPDARAVAGHFAPEDPSLDVHLAVPSMRAGAANFQADGGARPESVRYWQEAATVADETTGQNEQQLAYARSNLRLMFGDEISEGYSSIKIAELKRTPTGKLVVSDQHIPPALDIAASAWLAQALRQIVEILITKSSSLGEQRRQRTTSLADFTTSEVAVFWLLNTVNAHIPTLMHLTETRPLHPERLYYELVALCGKLMTFAVDRHPKDIVRYRHLDLYGTFSKLFEEIRLLLETVIPTRVVQIPLELARESVYTGRVEDERLLKEAAFYLGVTAQMPAGRLIERAPRVIKVASRDVIDNLIGSGLPGVALTHAQPPPAPIPVRVNFHYFSLDKNGVFWDTVRGSQSIAVYIPDEIVDEKVELYAVKP